jgi:hypothetical protein
MRPDESGCVTTQSRGCVRYLGTVDAITLVAPQASLP